jgi:hypothetical protein
MFHAGTALYMKTCVMFMVYYLSLTGMRRLTRLVSVSGRLLPDNLTLRNSMGCRPSALDHATVMYRDGPINEVAAQRPELRQDAILVAREIAYVDFGIAASMNSGSLLIPSQ